MAIERRLTEIVGPVGGKLHTARSRNDQVATDVAMLVRAHSLDRQGAAARSHGHARRAGRAPPRLAAARLHPPAARAAGVPLAPPARLLLEVPPRPPALQLLPHGHRRPAARRRRARRGELRHEPDVRGPGARLRRHRRELARRGVEPRLRARLPVRRGHLRHPPLAARRGDRALVEPGVRVLRGGRRVRVGLEPHAAEEEPGRRRAPARQGPAGGVAAGGHARRAPRAAAHLQQGPSGGQGAALRRDRHGRARSPGGQRHARRASASTASGWQPPPSDEFIAATDVADALVRRGVPVPRGARDRGRAGADRGRARQAPVRADATTSCTSWCPSWTGRSASSWSRRPGSSRRSRRAAPRSPGSASSSRRPATS